MMTRLLSTILCLSFWMPLVAATKERPNVLFLLSDDQAWNDYGFMGHPHINTPAIDQLAANSLTFTRGYTPVPLCRPSLASITTGLHPHQHGVTGNDPLLPKLKNAPARQKREDYLRLNAEIIQQWKSNPNMIDALTSAGYRTLQTGKWWEGNAVKTGGFTSGMTHGDPSKGGRHGDVGLKIGRDGLSPVFDFIKESGDQPWFIWYGVFLPHTPHNPPKELLDKYLKIAPTPAVARYWANCEWLDQGIGEMIQYLRDQGQLENTLIIYTCDNGWIQKPDTANRYAPRSKRTVYEGGVRTPIMISWQGTIEPLLDREHLVSNLDLWPTIAHLTRTNLPDGLTGVNLTDRKSVTSRNAIFGSGLDHDIHTLGEPVKSLQARFVIQGDWKLIIHHNGKTITETELFNLKDDPWETQNLAAKQPDRVAELTTTLNQWWNP